VRLLLDSHALIWWLENSPRLSAAARAGVADPTNEVLVSAASAWEIETKFRLGKLPGLAPMLVDLARTVAEEGFETLPITFQHGALAGRLDGEHRDPFDRMLIAQALVDDLVLVSNERLFDRFGVARLW